MPSRRLDPAVLDSMGNVPGGPAGPSGGNEEIVVSATADLPGVEVWSVSRSRRLFSVHHSTYAFCASDRMGGRQSWLYRRDRYQMTPASLMTIEPGELHITKVIERAADYRVLLVPEDLWRRTLAAEGREPALRLPGGQLEDPELVGRCKLACDAARSAWATPLERQELLGRFLGAVAARARDQAPPAPGKPCPELVQRARRYMEDCYTLPLSLEDVADAVGSTRCHLAHSFSRLMQLPLFEYLRRFRVARALDLLRRGERPADVAAAVGFADQSHMTRAFREHFGFTPGSFRRMTAARRSVSRNSRRQST
jgi:AraC-like DNA-binding protein